VKEVVGAARVLSVLLNLEAAIVSAPVLSIIISLRIRHHV
jgi:hypothetical protein